MLKGNADLQYIGDKGEGVRNNKVAPSGVIVNGNFAQAPKNPGLAFMGTAGDGLIIQTTPAAGPPTYQVKTVLDGLGSNFVSSIFVDSDRTIWVGTYHPDDFNQGGVSVSRDLGQSWETFRVNGIYDPLQRNRNAKLTGLTTNNIRDIKRDRLTSKLVIATDDGVLSALVVPNNVLPITIEESQAINDGIGFSHFSTLNGLGSNDVKTVIVEEMTVKTVRQDEPKTRTTWWAGTGSGLSRSVDQGTTWKTFDLSSQLLDLEGPALVFNLPANNAILTGLVNISIGATDVSPIRSVEISFDNKNFSPIPLVGANYISNFDSRKLPNGRTFLYARAFDAFGNESFATPLVLTVNNPLPLSQLTANVDDPGPNATISDIFPVRISTISDVAIARVEVTGDPLPDQVFADAQRVLAPKLVPDSLTLFESVYEYPFDTTSIQSGNMVTLTVRATDENGRQANATRTFMVFNRLPDVQSIAVAGHTIWAGTMNQCGLALSQDNGRNWKYFTIDNGLPSNNIQAVAIRKDEVWVGTDMGLAMSANRGKNWLVFNSTVNNLPNNDVRYIAFQGTTTWVGTANGLGKLVGGSSLFQAFRVPEGLANNLINHIFVDCDQITIWVSTSGGISVTKNGGQTWRPAIRTNNSGLPSDQVNAIVRYRNDIYAATANGLGISNNEGTRFIRLPAPTIGDNLVLSLRVDGGDLWIGTRNGLTKLDSEDRFVTYRREGVFNSFGQILSDQNVGLKSNFIHSIAQ